MQDEVLLEDLQENLNQISTCLNDSVTSLADALKQVLYIELNKDAEYTHQLEKLNVYLRPIIQEKLKKYQYCSGAGFASHIYNSKNKTDYWLLEWWFKKASPSQHQQLQLDQATQQRLDFRTFEWFVESKESESIYIHGPYVDYICNTSYTLTVAYPIFIENTFIGVAVIDLLVSKLEELLASYFKKIKYDLLITNSDGRVILSNNITLRVGDLIKNTSTSHYNALDHGFFKILYKAIS